LQRAFRLGHDCSLSAARATLIVGNPLAPIRQVPIKHGDLPACVVAGVSADLLAAQTGAANAASDK
jgi:hypothetical protein